jgi:hypothetical protein
LLIVFGIGGHHAPYAVAGLVVLFGGLLVVLIGGPFIWSKGRLSGEWIWLSFVNERFAEELERWYGDDSRRP